MTFHVLIVDDDITFAQVLARALGKRGFATTLAHNSTDALAAARAHAATQSLTHAIVDLKIAEESGLQLIAQLVQVQPDIDIVMLTGYASIATAVEAVKLGAIHYLCKPASIDEILDAFALKTGNADLDLPDAPMSVDRLEWEHIQKVLQDNDGNISATARVLGMHRRTLQRKLAKRPARS
jgi:two-component system response regulator RegA